MTVFEQDNKWLTLTATTCNSIVSEAVSFPNFVLMGKLPTGVGAPSFSQIACSCQPSTKVACFCTVFDHDSHAFFSEIFWLAKTA
jgi:hypothetical protein